MFYSLEICNKTTKLRYLRFRSTDLLRMIWKNWVHWELGTMELCWRWITRRRGQRWPSRCAVARKKERWRGGGEEKGRERVCVFEEMFLSPSENPGPRAACEPKRQHCGVGSGHGNWHLSRYRWVLWLSHQRGIWGLNGSVCRDSVGLYNHRTPSLLLLYTYYLMVGRS